MEGTRRAVLRFAVACCLLCALPGEAQERAEDLVTPPPLSTVLTSPQPGETSDFNLVTAAAPETSLERNLTVVTLNATENHATEVENAPIPTTPMVGTQAERLQASPTASPRDDTVTQYEHHNLSVSVNDSAESPPPPTPTAGSLEESQPSHNVTELLSTTEETDDTSSPTPTPLSSVPATTNSSQLGTSVGPTATRSETRPGTSPVGATEESTMEPRTSAPISTVGSTSSATASGTMTVRPLVTSSTTTRTAAIPASTSALEQPLEPMHEKASVLDVGDDENSELPSSPLADTTRADPLVITVISVFIVMVGILGLVGFLRYRQHNSRMEFRRLQDLPMVPLLPSRV
ncbi:uncharacterized protein LJ264_006216 isoform 2-T2 [Porphyrio hochstetteri]